MNSGNVEIAVYLAPTGQYMQQPWALSSVHEFVSYQGRVGELQDVHLVSVEKTNWDTSRQEILGALRGTPGIIRVEAQQHKQRSKRIMDEF